MTSKERLLRCIQHEPIDRVPVSTYELVGWNMDAWENKEPSYGKLMNVIREKTDCIYMMNPGEREIALKPADIKKWSEGKSQYIQKVFQTPNGDLTAVQREDQDVHTVWTLKHLLDDLEDIDKYLSIPYSPSEFDMKDFFKRKDELGDKGLMMISVDDPICQAAELFEMGKFLIYAITEQDKIKYFLDAIFERQLHSLKTLLKNDVKDVIFRVCGPEYATPPYLHPDYYDEYVTCYLKIICEEIKQAGGIARIHSHGKIGKVIEQFASTEAECIDPVEPIPDGDIELDRIKELYGDKFCLFGNIELKELETSNRDRIDFLVKKAMASAKEGSGFVLMPTASPINAPLSKKTEENYLQMIESAYEYGKY